MKTKQLIVCSSACLPRCPSCAPSSPAGAPVPLVRLHAARALFCPCPMCGAAARVLAGGGATTPFCWCATCGSCSPTPTRSRWSATPVDPVPQLALF